MTVSSHDLRSHQRVKAPRSVLNPDVRPITPGPRLEAKRARIVDAALRHFAEHGYHAARIEDLSAQLGVAKGSIFQYFNISAARADCFWKRTKKRCALFRRIWIARRRFAKRDFSKFCATGCCAKFRKIPF